MTGQQSSAQSASPATPRTPLLRDHQVKGTNGSVRIDMDGGVQPVGRQADSSAEKRRVLVFGTAVLVGLAR